MSNDHTREDAIELGRETAEENLKQEQAESTSTTPTNEHLENARDTAEANHKEEQRLNDELEDNDHALENDTSNTAKVATAKSQLDPTGDDPISGAEVRRSALDASMDTGNKTSLSNEEAAKKAHEENSKSQPTEVPVDETTKDEPKTTADKS